MNDYKICPTCKMPYGTLPPIGEPKQIVLPSGEIKVPGTLSETISTEPAAPKFVDLFATPSELIKPPTLPAILPAALQAEKQEEPQLVAKYEQKPRGPSPVAIDDPAIGGRVTVCALLYGDYYEMHKRCINSILSSTPADRVQLRIACNEVNDRTIAYLSRLKSEGRIYKVVVNQLNIKKYPAMRRLFHDPEDPITDKWIFWFDDDSIADKDPKWFDKLLTTIVKHWPQKSAMYGDARIWTLQPGQAKWIRSRPWYTGRAFQLKGGQEAPNGNKIRFVCGGFWAINTEVMKHAQVPDPEIGHNGGDYMIGEQVWQAGYGVKIWNQRKQFVHTSSVSRRGLNEHHTGTTRWQPGGVPK